MHSLVKVPHIELLHVLVFKITITITKKNFIFARIKFIEKISRQVFMTVLLIVNYNFFFVYCCKMNIYLISLPCEIFFNREMWNFVKKMRRVMFVFLYVCFCSSKYFKYCFHGSFNAALWLPFTFRKKQNYFTLCLFARGYLWFHYTIWCYKRLTYQSCLIFFYFHLTLKIFNFWKHSNFETCICEWRNTASCVKKTITKPE